MMTTRYQITVTPGQRREIGGLDIEEQWERLADITEHPVEWLKETIGGWGVEFVESTREESGVVTAVHDSGSVEAARERISEVTRDGDIGVARRELGR